MKHDRRRSRRLSLLRFRYAMPLICTVLTALYGFLPCMRFTVGGEAGKQNVALWGLMSNAWTVIRQYLFHNEGQKDSMTTAFSTTVTVLMALCIVLLLAALALAVWELCVGLHAIEGHAPNAMRRWYVAVFPHRTIPSVLYLLPLPLTLFPHMLVACYDRLLIYAATVQYTFAPPFATALVLWLMSVILSAVCVRYERIEGPDPYALRHASCSDSADSGDGEDVEKHYDRREETPEEKTERLRRLFGEGSDTQP